MKKFFKRLKLPDLNMSKIVDLLNKSDVSVSFEVTPDVDLGELDSLDIDPLFFSVIWHAKTHKNENLNIPPLRLAKQLRSKNKEVMLHISCDMMKKEYLGGLLDLLQELGIRNLFVVLGDKYNPASSDFSTSEDLIKGIKEETGNYFCIGVAGLPDCSDERLHQLKNKIDAGADFILTQAFFEPALYSIFTLRCRTNGVNVPIIPGVFPFETYKELSGFINVCKIRVSQNILDCIGATEEAIEMPGKEITRNLMKEITAASSINHFHLFTLNRLAKSASIVKPLL